MTAKVVRPRRQHRRFRCCLAGLAMLACYLPARKATEIDRLAALLQE